MNRLEKGFTLIEILVATVILFSTIATVSLVYRGAILSSEKARSHAVIDGKLPVIVAQIESELREKGPSNEEFSGTRQVWDVTYQWNATVESFRPPQPQYSPELGGLEEFPARYKLWQVELSIKYNDLIKTYSYKEVSW